MPYGIAVSFKPSAMVESKNLLFRVRCGSTSIVVEPPPAAADTASEVQPCTLPEAINQSSGLPTLVHAPIQVQD